MRMNIVQIYGVFMMHVITCCSLPWNGLSRCYINSSCIFQKRVKVKKLLGPIEPEGIKYLPILVVLTFGNINSTCISTYCGVNENWKNQLVRDLDQTEPLERQVNCLGTLIQEKVRIRLVLHPVKIYWYWLLEMVAVIIAKIFMGFTACQQGIW